MSLTDTPSQGYVTLAFGDKRFFEMAVNVALSVKLNDPKRPVCLIHKASTPPSEEIARAFDHLAPIENEADYPKGVLKLGIYQPSPYQETMFIDADAVILKTDMDRHWEKYRAQPFMIAGAKQTSGSIFGSDVTEMMEAANLPYAINMNSGIIYYRKSPEAAAIFDDAMSLVREANPAFMLRRGKRGYALSDQPYFAAAMAKHEIDPIGYSAEEGTIMATTYRARRINFDILGGLGNLEKPKGFYLLDRLLAKGWVKHSTSIGHFIDAKPLPLYQNMSDQLRDHFDWPRFAFPG